MRIMDAASPGIIARRRACRKESEVHSDEQGRTRDLGNNDSQAPKEADGGSDALILKDDAANASELRAGLGRDMEAS